MSGYYPSEMAQAKHKVESSEEFKSQNTEADKIVGWRVGSWHHSIDGVDCSSVWNPFLIHSYASRRKKRVVVWDVWMREKRREENMENPRSIMTEPYPLSDSHCREKPEVSSRRRLGYPLILGS